MYKPLIKVWLNVAFAFVEHSVVSESVYLGMKEEVETGGSININNVCLSKRGTHLNT